MNNETLKKIDYRTRKTCPECKSRIISNHFGKFKCHDCGYCILYDENGYRVL